MREKIREWCIEKAIELLGDCKVSYGVEDVVKNAKKIEEYIWSREK